MNDSYLKLTVLSYLCFLSLSSFAQEDFKWTWDQTSNGVAPVAEAIDTNIVVESSDLPEPASSLDIPEANDVPVKKKTVSSNEDFNWSWDDTSAIQTTPTPKTTPAPVETTPAPVVKKEAPELPAHASLINTKDYDNLLKENLELRQKIDASEKLGKSIRKQNDKLVLQTKDLENKIMDSVAKIEELNKRKVEQNKESPGKEEKIAELERLLTNAKAVKAQQSSELKGLHDKIANMEKANASLKANMEAIKVEKVNLKTTVQKGSDLFKQMEQENVDLKDKLVQLEEDRQKALRERDDIVSEGTKADQRIAKAEAKAEEMKKKLVQAENEKEESKKMLSKLMKKVPDLEKDFENMKTDVQESHKELSKKDQEIMELKTELERREHRIIKAEQIQRELEKAREEVRKVSDSENRDMHYNMASVYAKDGRYKDAEREYLEALRIDPSDADLHYNLGILYDDNLKDKRKAALHYRRYLKLKPHAEDADDVRTWLMNIDLQ